MRTMYIYFFIWVLFLLFSCKQGNNYHDSILLDTCTGKYKWQLGYSDTIKDYISEYEEIESKNLSTLYISCDNNRTYIKTSGKDSVLPNVYYYENGKICKTSFFNISDSVYLVCIPQPIQVFSGVLFVYVQNSKPTIMNVLKNPSHHKYHILGQPLIIQKQKGRIALPLLEHHWASEFVGDILVWEIEGEHIIYKGLLETNGDYSKGIDNLKYVQEVDSLLLYGTKFKENLLLTEGGVN